MPKTFYTERDIEDLASRGVLSLVVNDDVVLTALAREKAERLGVELLREHDTPPSAPVRPYVAVPSPAAAPKEASGGAASLVDLQVRVRDAVVAQLGDEVDPALLDTLLKRVLSSVG